MAEYTLKYINHRAECDAEAFVNDCEEHYHRQLHQVADQIAANCMGLIRQILANWKMEQEIHRLTC